MLAGRQPFDIPEVACNNSVRQVEALIERCLELRQCWRNKFAERLQSIQFSVASPYRNYRDNGSAVFERELYGAQCPLDCFVFEDAATTEKDKNAKIDAIIQKKARGGV